MLKQLNLVIILFLFFTFICNSQNYKKVDSIVSVYPSKYSSVLKLSKKISSDFSNDFERVRAIYTWITNNIVYDITEYGKYNFEYSTNIEFEKKERKHNKKLASRVLSKGKAVCEGYAILFNTICKNLNIKSKIVSGSSKTLTKDIGKRYYSDHAWNIVIIDDKKYLIDTTWGAENRNREVNYFYFLTEPKLFIKDHYPNYYENALLNRKIEKEDFLEGPLIYNHNFTLIAPISGILKKAEINKVKFQFSSNKKVSNVKYKIGRKEFQLTKFENNEFLEFEIDLSGLKTERELILYFDLEPIVGFKLK